MPRTATTATAKTLQHDQQQQRQQPPLRFTSANMHFRALSTRAILEICLPIPLSIYINKYASILRNICVCSRRSAWDHPIRRGFPRWWQAVLSTVGATQPWGCDPRPLPRWSTLGGWDLFFYNISIIYTVYFLFCFFSVFFTAERI